MSTLKKISFSDDFKINSSALTLGNFDGFHIGHQSLVSELINLSGNLKKIIITFNPHTQKILANINKFNTITNHNYKLDLISKCDIDYVSTINFDKNFSKLNANDFINLILKKYNPKIIMIGYDSKFGYKGKGDYFYLKEYLKNTNIKVLVNNPFILNKEIIKSSSIKDLISIGDIKKVNSFLGRPFKLFGIITEGRGQGRKLGYPTANLNLHDKQQIIPKVGVYYVNLIVGSKRYMSICNIGHKPTYYKKADLTIETHVLNEENLDLYGKEVELDFYDFIRNEIKFNKVDDLKFQIKNDIKQLKAIKLGDNNGKK
ncbi:MAG: hypothetical protein CMG61_01325 [Candidatus Marinimicrobia bacterium]|nr:hypothetical protein [Candidatus Neomarinimicrobiota bacterium]|tara:strand:+ start:18754 stop:19701 length:948 start_codon:yes stop_codon:yes gene_type:complete